MQHTHTPEAQLRQLGITEGKFDKTDAEYILLTKTLRLKEGLNEENNATTDADLKDVTKVAEYLFLTEQMG